MTSIDETTEQAAARRFVARHFPEVTAFLASGDAQPDEDLMRVDAPQVTPLGRQLRDFANRLRDLADDLAGDLDDVSVDVDTAGGETQASANACELNAIVAKRERTIRLHHALFAGLSAERLHELEDLSDSDAPAALIAERLATLALWQQQLSELETVAVGAPALRPALDAQRAAWQQAYARTTSAFTGWYFGGWAALPDTAETSR